MNDNYITLTIGKKKNIALIAHDNKKADLIEWCEQNKDILTQHFLCGTGTDVYKRQGIADVKIME